MLSGFVKKCWSLRRAVGFAALSCGLGLTAEQQVQAEPPKLIVVVSVDQLCEDYLIRFEDNFSNEGIFRRIDREGSHYTNCHHRHSLTVTAPGHAVQLTGAYPGSHGVIENNWYDRDLKKRKYCVSDPLTKVVGIESKNPMSPRVLRVDTVGDRMKLASRQAKVFGLAIKDRASILMSGHAADAAYWMEKNNWVTTEYYRPDLPSYLQALNAANFLDAYRGKQWKLLHPQAKYRNIGPDKNDWENPPKGFDTEFPHDIFKPGEGGPDDLDDQVLASPFGNEVTLSAAKELVKHEELGKDGITDLLCINLSSNDYVGHAFGPHSYEVEDITYRTDLDLGEFAKYLDKQVGQNQWTLFITADHGVAPVVQVAQQLKLPAVRNPLPIDVIKVELEAHLRTELGVAADVKPPLIEFVEDLALYLDQKHPALKGDRLPQARRIARDWIAKHRYVATAKTREDLLYGSGDEVHNAMRRMFHPQLSGDVQWCLTPYCVPGTSKKGTTHGSPWFYDTHVPLLALGHGIKNGRFDRLVSPACLASTVAKLAHVDAPGGNVETPLSEALGLNKAE